MEKNLLLLLLILALGFSLAGCGSFNSEDNTDKSDVDLINELLNHYQAAIENNDTDRIISLCAFPFKFEGDTYDSDELKVFFGIKFTLVSDYNLDNRTLTINGNSATVEATLYEQFEFNQNDETYSAEITCVKINGTWKISDFES